MNRQQLIKQIREIPALVSQLKAIAEDGGTDWELFPRWKIYAWAESRLENFYEDGHTLNDMLTGQLSKQEQSQAKAQVKRLKKLLKELAT